MKKLLWTSAMALTAAACMTACDDSSSGSYEIPSYASGTSLPDTCSMEVAKVDTAYFACFENKWIEVTDSATVEQLKEGLDEEEIKAKLEELQSLLPKPADNTPKPTSSSAQGEVEGSDNEGDSSSSSEEEESSSSSKKKKDKDKDDSGSGSGEGGSGEGGEGGESTPKRDAHFSPIDDYVTWSKDGKTATLSKTIDEATIDAAGFLIIDVGENTKKAQIALNNVGSVIEPAEGNVILMITKKEPTDSNSYIVQVEEMKEGSSIYTDISPLGKCGESMYPKRTKFCDTRGTGTTYKYVTIGTQTWMAENMNYETESGAYCHDNTKNDCGTYGLLYTIEAALTDVCPDGWHLPEAADFKDLIAYVDGITAYKESNTAGKKLKATEGWGTTYTGTDDFGFSALPAGEYNTVSPGYNFKDTGFFWSNTKSTTTTGFYYAMYIKYDNATLVDYNPGRAQSVRCIKDASAE